VTCAAKLLAYCVVQDPGPPLPATGVRGAPIRTVTMGTLCCVYSPLIPPQEFSREDALSFHSVLKTAFEHASIIPFRFPTIIQNEEELRTHLREKSPIYLKDLKRLRDLVQMELRFTADQATSKAAKTGTEYLQNKQQLSRKLQSSSQEARAVLGDLVVEWKERPTDQGLRCYALIKRKDIATARASVEAARFNGPATIMLSGPWPATEFLHE
jgi:gas vesicle protein GvpL/GvpF